MNAHSIVPFARRTKQETPAHVIRFFEMLSYQSVRKGRVPTDFLQPKDDNLKYITELYKKVVNLPVAESGDALLETANEFVDLMKRQDLLNRFTDDDNIDYELSNLPVDGAEIDSGFAALIRNRFRVQFESALSSGRAAACFESHINYIIGSSTILTEVQYKLISNLCRIAATRPLPSLFIAHNILNHLDEPQALRVILTASIWNKKRAVDRLYNMGCPVYYKFFDNEDRSPEILLLGFSQSQIALIKSVSECCKEFNKNLLVCVPDEDTSKAAPDQIVQHLNAKGINAELRGVQQLSRSKISLALSGSKIVTWSRSGNVEVLFDKAPADFYKRVILGNFTEYGTFDRIPVIATSGLFKFWPRVFRLYYKDKLDKAGLDNLSSEYAYLSSRTLTHLVSEHGITDVSRLQDAKLIEDLDHRPTALDSLFLSAAVDLNENSLRDGALDQVLKLFVERKVIESEDSDFWTSAEGVSSFLLGRGPASMSKETGFGRQLDEVRAEVSFESMSTQTPSEGAHHHVPEVFRRYDPDSLRNRLEPLREAWQLGVSEDWTDQTLREHLFGLADSIYKTYREEGRDALKGLTASAKGPFTSSRIFLKFVRNNIDSVVAKRGNVEFESLMSKADNEVREEAEGLADSFEIR